MTPQPQADWQNSFVATNLLPLSYNAWSRFLTGKRGDVAFKGLAEIIPGLTQRNPVSRRNRVSGFGCISPN